jgi:hypothetical protein
VERLKRVNKHTRTFANLRILMIEEKKKQSILVSNANFILNSRLTLEL